jgi:Shikimate kinase
MRRLGLIGFSGSGKSSLAAIASKSGFKTVDTDSLIEKQNPEAFRLLEDGTEDDFRTLETSVISEVLKSDFDFAAFGGGIHFAHPAWKEIYESSLKLVYLRSSFENLAGRFEERPLCRKLGLEGYEKLFKSRCPLYEKAAAFVVDTDGRGLSEIWSEVFEIWNSLFQ